MTVNIYTTSGGSTPEVHTNVISVTVSDPVILLTEQTATSTKSILVKLSDVTSVNVTGV